MATNSFFPTIQRITMHNDTYFRRTRFTILLLLFLPFVVLLAGCKSEISESYETTYQSRFETDLEEWSPQGIDLELGNGTIDWSITRSQDRFTEGTYSVKYYLNNLNDAGKIWLERSFPVLPSKTYNVKVMYDFASQDFGDINLFTIITGVHQQPPRTREELQKSFKGNTGTRSTSDAGYMWLPKQYEFTVNSDATGSLVVVIGIWGTWETSQTYYVDNVRVTFSFKQ